MATVTKVDAQYTVETPEGVDFQFRIAGPGRRAGAFIIDAALKIGIVFVLSIGLSLFGWLPESILNSAMGVLVFVLFLLLWLYPAIFETYMRGQTPGKWILNLRVVRSNGTPVDGVSAFGRSLMQVADIFPGTALVGTLSMLMTPRMQRLGDVILDTIVIHEKREYSGMQLRQMAPVKPIEQSDCTGRFQVPERTLALIETLFDANRYVAGGRREELARILAIPVSNRMGYQLPNIEGNYYVDPHTQEYFGDYSLFLRRVLTTFRTNETPTVAIQNPDIPPASFEQPAYLQAASQHPSIQSQQPVTNFPGVQTTAQQSTVPTITPPVTDLPQPEPQYDNIIIEDATIVPPAEVKDPGNDTTNDSSADQQGDEQ